MSAVEGKADIHEKAKAAALLLRVAYAVAIYHNHKTIQPEDLRAAARALRKLKPALKSQREVDLSTMIV